MVVYARAHYQILVSLRFGERALANLNIIGGLVIRSWLIILPFFFTMTATLSFFLLLACTAAICSCNVTLEYVRRVRRLQSPSTLDYCFICEAEGQVLQWGADTSSLVGYRKDEVGRTVINAQMDFTVTSTLLLARPLEDGGTLFVSVLVISTAGDELSLSVSCTNNIVLSNISTDYGPKYRSHDDKTHFFKNRTIVFDYILSLPLLQQKNSSVVLHIFMCGTESLSQLVGRDDRGLGFSKKHKVGETRNDLSADSTKVNIEAILISREQFETTSLVFIISNSNFTAKCSFGSTQIQLQSQQAFAEYFVTPMPESSIPWRSSKMYDITATSTMSPIIISKCYS